MQRRDPFGRVQSGQQRVHGDTVDRDLARERACRNPVSPARAVFERIRLAIGWRTAIDVIATTLPHFCVAHRGHGLVTHRDRRAAVELERARGTGRRSCARSRRRADRPRSARGCRCRRARRARHARSPSHRRPSTRRRRSAPRPAPMRSAAAVDRVLASRPQIATRTPSAASASRDAEAEALETRRRPRPLARRYRDPRNPSWTMPCVSVDGARSVAQRRGVTPGPQRDDLGADRDRGLLGRAGADVETDRRHDARRSRRRSSPRLAQPPDPPARACAASPSRRGSRRRSSPPPRSRGRRTCGRA